ncbi:HicB family toxin-antitoxin system [Geodermatophilus chilensis]|uniref:HicB family toxin-antitoxin system n=1 Tax=Geodermatophilus chilensis TaxID=2035835 RepID=UPI000C25855A|nr:HicB family toxin-antitoxin system [Geodermatophilus chilensis]
MSEYRAIARREGRWWAIEVPGVGWTQARRLDQVEHMACDLVASMNDVDPSTVSVTVEAHVSDELDELRERAASLGREAEEATARAQSEKRRLVHELQAANLPARDIGQLAGISHQRVSQLTKPDRASGPTEVVTYR